MNIRYLLTKNIKLKNQLKKFYFLVQRFFRIFTLNKHFLYGYIALEVGPKADNFFGYYDKKNFNKNRNLILTNILKGDQISISTINLDESRIVRELYSSSAWNYQQGAMAEWIDNDLLIFNDFKDSSLKACLFNIKDQSTQVLNEPVQAIIPNSNKYLSINYNLLTKYRPEYGYKNLCQLKENLTEDQFGITLCDFKNNNKLIISIYELRLANKLESNVKSKINHLTVSPDGKKFIFMYRYFLKNQKYSVLYLFDLDKGRYSKIMKGTISHYCWYNSDSLIVWHRDNLGKGLLSFIEINTTENTFDIKWSTEIRDGHPTSDGIDIIIDTYPDIFSRQKLYKINVKNGEKTLIANFKVNIFRDESKRCDLHPKIWDGKIFIDINIKNRGQLMLVNE